MPDQPLDPFTALDAIRVFAQVALDQDDPTVYGQQLVLREILNACERAMVGEGRKVVGEGERQG